MNREEFEVVLKEVTKAIHEQYMVPVLMALGTLTATICVRDPELAEALADSFRSQAKNCRESDAAGWVYLEKLADLSSADKPSLPDDLRTSVRNALRLIEGGKYHAPEPQGGFDKS